MRSIEDEDPRDDDDDDGEEGEEPVVAAPPPPPPPAPAKNKGGRPRKPQSTSFGVGATANVPVPSTEDDPTTWDKEVTTIWPLLIDWMARGCGKNQPMGPDAIRMNVWRVSGVGVVQPVMLGTIDGESVVGSVEHFSAGEALRNRIIDDFHIPTAPAMAKYKVEVQWKRTGRNIRSGELLLPSRDEIRQLRIAQESRMAAAGQQPPPWQGMPPVGAGAASPWTPPPPQYPQQHSQYQQQPPWMQPPQGQSSTEQQLRFEIERLKEDKARTQGTLDSAMRAVQEGRQPTFDQSVPAASSTSGVVAEVIAALVALKIIPQAGATGVGAAPAPSVPQYAPASPPVAAPAPPPPAADPLAGIEVLLGQLGRLKKIGRAVDVLTGDAIDAVAEPVPNEPPPVPDDGLDWVATATGAKWPDGSDIVFTKKKDGTGINWAGIAFSNGPVGTKLMELGEQVIRPMAEGVQKMMNGMMVQTPQGPVAETPPQDSHAAHVTNGIPTNARDAGGDFPAT